MRVAFLAEGSPQNQICIFELLFFLVSAMMMLAVPTTQHSMVVAHTTDIGKIEPRFLAILQQCDVAEKEMVALVNTKVLSAGLFGHIAKDEDGVIAFLKATCNIDVEQRAEDWIIRSQLLMAWESCRTRGQVEIKEAAQRAVCQLPPQLALGDHERARKAFENIEHMELPEYLTPSESYFERKIGQVQTFFEAESLCTVTNKCQQDSNMTSAGVDFDSRGVGTFKLQKKDFGVSFPDDPESFKHRIKVVGICHMFLKLMFPSNPKLATIDMEVFRRYSDYLCGPMVWGFVAKNEHGMPTSSPHVGHVIAYDLAIRKFICSSMNGGADFKSAMESALRNESLRSQNFTTPFAVDAGSKKCLEMTAPGLSEQYGLLQGRKRKAEESARPANVERPEGSLSKSAKAKARKQKAKDEAATTKARAEAKAAARAASKGTSKGTAKGAGKGGKSALPDGIKKRCTAAAGPGMEGKSICYSWSQGVECRVRPCTFEHVCWKCESRDHRGKDCTVR